ncbi:MAG: hypothetical protein QNJ98_08850 [Planctomycetota bacterium]|nr:hypothetical protein [Planctomycetota bacterium]
MLKHKMSGLLLLLVAAGLMFGCGDKAADEPADTGKTTPASTDDVFVAKEGSLEDLQKVAAALDLEISDVGEIEVHRGSGDDDVTIYWPQENVTKEGLQTFRIDVGDEYEDDGTLEFRIGKKVLYSEPFAPEDTVTVAAIPQSVLDALKRGKTVKWGVFYEGRKKRDSVSRTFKLVDGKKASKRLKKMEGSKHFQRQIPLTRELLRTQVLEDHRLYSEALVQYLGILQVWPDSIQPFRGIVMCCRRMDLKETPLFTIASTFVRGKGSKTSSQYKPRPGATPNTPQAHTSEAKIVLRAPTFQNRGPDGFRPTQLGEHGGTKQPTSQPGTTAPGTAQPGGTGVQPGTARPGDPTPHEGLGRHADELQAHATAQAQEAKMMRELATQMGSLQNEIQNQEREEADARQVLAEKEAEVARLEAYKGERQPGMPPPPENLDELYEQAIKDRNAAEARLEKERLDLAKLQKQYTELQTQAGMDLNELQEATRMAEKMAEHLQGEADKARAAFEMETGTPEQQEQMRQAARIAEREANIAGYRAEINKAEKATQETEKKVMDLRRQIAGLDPDDPTEAGEIARLNQQMTDLNEQWQSERQALQEMKDQLEEFLRN